MRLKIVHQNQENMGREELVMKKESVETGDQMEETRMNPALEDGSTKENSMALEVSPTTAACPVLVTGKRKRKPKEQLIDEFSLLISSKKKKKKQSFPKSKFGTPDDGGTSMRSVPFKSPTMIRAEEVQLSLGNDQPSFLKVLVRSHVGSCFWMGLPVPFCRLHLPAEDATVNLENETGDEFGIKYIAHKTGLSAGWRKFVAGNKLLEGDVLIFQLVGPCSFKVYIIRANDLTEVDGALSLLTLEYQTKQSDAEGKLDLDAQGKKKTRPRSLPLVVFKKLNQKEGSSMPQLGQPEEHSGIDSDEVASEVLEDSKFSGFSLPLKDVQGFEGFHIMINGACIDPELPENIRRKYYVLCCSKNMFLHDHLLPGLSSKLAAGMIFEAVNTADAIQACKLTTPKKEFEVWEKSLKSFELLGLEVGFLQARLRRLQSLSFDSEDAFDTKRYLDVKTNRSRIEVDIQNLEEKLVELEELSAKYDGEIEGLKTKAESYEMNFQDEANAKW
ncbi:B3 domain-containing protein Os01g0234100-like isoform X2 [Primulina huaijiensis]|uniref:B3 domain-containing protein Os01g0234100-like isoform X2 n=1 Tax=Primulina huaijiensis TaxID=1492673 RepID=UPI003CC70E2E